MKTNFFETSNGEGLTYSPNKGNYWGKIVCYSTSKINEHSKQIAFKKIPIGAYINGYGTKKQNTIFHLKELSA